MDKPTLKLDAVSAAIVRRQIAKKKAEILSSKTSHARRRLLFKPPRPMHPDSVARDYKRELKKYLTALKGVTLAVITPRIKELLDKAAEKRPTADSRQDGYSDDIKRMMREAKVSFSEDFTPEEIKSIAQRMAKKGNDFNLNDMNRVFKKVVGIDVFATEPWLKQEMAAFVKENVGLIKSISGQYFDQVENIVQRGVRSGYLTSEVKEEIQKRFSVTESRAELIARDQIAKFNGDLTRLRQQNVGVNKYTWSTSMDERVRDSHAEKEGNVYSWDNPPADTGNPGEDFQCVPEFALTSLYAPAKKAFRRWHNGELTQVISEAPETLRVTPNHPVLTLRGWVPAKLLKVGDYLIEAAGQAFNPSINHPQGRHSSAHEIFRSFRKNGLLHWVSGRASWFHGDSTDEQIEVINLKRELFFDSVAERSKMLDQQALSDPAKSAFADGYFSFGRVAFEGSPAGMVSGLSQSHSLRLASLLHPKKHRFRAATDGRLAFNQNATDRSPAQIELFSDSLLAHAVQIKPDDFCLRKVKKVLRTPWSGWVHNFETVTGWYASVNLVIHNCRCVAIPVFEDTPDEE